MQRYFLIDFENVSDEGLTGFPELNERDTVVLFYTDKACKIRISFMEELGSLPHPAKLRFMNVVSGNQALDMQLATYLGSMMNTASRDTEFVIVSKDKGYNHIIQFWKVRRSEVKISLKKSILDAVIGRAEETAPAEKTNEPKKESDAKKGNEQKKPEPENHGPEVGKTTGNGGTKKAPLNPGQEKTRLNAAVQRILSDAKYDTSVISFVASYAVKCYGTPNSKRAIYTAIIKQYGQKEGLDIYTLIKKEL